MTENSYPVRTNFPDGIGITVLSQVGIKETPKNFGRRELAPTNPSSDYYLPTYQFAVAASENGAGYEGYAWLHIVDTATYPAPGTHKIVRSPISDTADLNSLPAVADAVTFPDTTLATACDWVYMDDLDLHAGVISYPDIGGGDEGRFIVPTGLGVYAAPGANTLSSVDLGLDQLSPTPSFPISIAAKYEGEGIIRVLACFVQGTPGGTGTIANADNFLTMVAFAIDASVSPPVVSEQAYRVTSDRVFFPHQLTNGIDVPLNGTNPVDMTWCIGRADSNTIFPHDGGTPRVPAEFSVAPDTLDFNLHNMGAEGVWVASDPARLDGWTRVWHASNQQTGSPESAVTPGTAQVPAPSTYPVMNLRDLGLAFDPSWQRMTAVGIDTDSSQDPIVLWPFENTGR